MKITRLFTGADQCSHFEELDISLTEIEIGKISEAVSADRIVFGEIDKVKEINWHNPPCRQYIIMLEGAMEMEIGDGARRIFHPCEILLAEDTTGQGHITRAASNGIRKYMSVSLKGN